jgi:hypothetical protein
MVRWFRFGEGSMRVRARALRLVGVLALVAAPIVALSVTAGAVATTFHVTNTNDAGDGSLRKAIADAAANVGDDTVEVDVSGTITLTTGPIVWNGDGTVTINGHGITLDAGGAESALIDLGGDGFTVNSMTVTGVAGTDDADIAPLFSEGGGISANDCTITGNVSHSTSGDVGGAILSEGGGITVNNCTITNNRATADDGDAAGGILSEGGGVTIDSSTITGNTGTAGDEGGDAAGGVLSEGGGVTITVSTISANTGSAADGDAGGGLLSEGGGITIRNSSLNCSSASAPTGDAGGGIISEGGGITLNGTSVQGNTATGENSENQIFDGGSTPSGTGNTISDDTTVCAAPPPPPPPPVNTAPNFTG